MDGIIPACSVCLISLAVCDEPTRLRNCGHSYHRGCVTDWLRKNSHCPDCRKDSTEADVQKDFVLLSIIDSMKKLQITFESPPEINNSFLFKSAPAVTTPTSASSSSQQSHTSSSSSSSSPLYSSYSLSSSAPPSVATSSSSASLPSICAYHVHPVIMVNDPKLIYPPSGQWFCDVCHTASLPSSVMYHCMTCGTFDMCTACFTQGSSISPIHTSRHAHPVTLSDPNHIYSKYRGKWHCDVCRKNNQPEMYHCFVCQDFDMCGSCRR